MDYEEGFPFHDYSFESVVTFEDYFGERTSRWNRFLDEDHLPTEEEENVIKLFMTCFMNCWQDALTIAELKHKIYRKPSIKKIEEGIKDTGRVNEWKSALDNKLSN